MSINEILKIETQFKAFKITPQLEELIKVQKQFGSFIKPVLSPELEKLAKILESSVIRMNNYSGMSGTVQFKQIYKALANRAEFVEYNIDLLKPALDEAKPEKVNIEVVESKRLRRIISDIYNDPETLLKINPREFEEIVAELLFAQGFKVELTKQTRDNGYDIIAIKDLKSQSPLKFLVECKRFTKQKVGVEIIRSFKEVILTEKANRGVIVTTSYFTSDAQKKQKETPYLLDYRDKDKVVEWVNEYYLQKICS